MVHAKVVVIHALLRCIIQAPVAFTAIIVIFVVSRLGSGILSSGIRLQISRIISVFIEQLSLRHHLLPICLQSVILFLGLESGSVQFVQNLFTYLPGTESCRSLFRHYFGSDPRIILRPCFSSYHVEPSLRKGWRFPLLSCQLEQDSAFGMSLFVAAGEYGLHLLHSVGVALVFLP